MQFIRAPLYSDSKTQINRAQKENCAWRSVERYATPTPRMNLHALAKFGCAVEGLRSNENQTKENDTIERDHTIPPS
jgi:hypothetical protein